MAVSNGKHLMELPSVVLAGREVLAEMGDLMRSQGLAGNVVVASGPHVWANLGKRLTANLDVLVEAHQVPVEPDHRSHRADHLLLEDQIGLRTTVGRDPDETRVQSMPEAAQQGLGEGDRQR